MHTNIKQTGSEYLILLSGRFDFSAHCDFRSSYEPALQNASIKTINLSMDRVDFVDSAALGMMLLLQEKARAANIEVVISNCQKNIREIIDVANFGKLFRVL